MDKLKQTLVQTFVNRSKPVRSTEAVSMVSTSILIGLLVGLAAVGFYELIGFIADLIENIRSWLGGTWGSIWVVFIPALGGLLITPIVVSWSPDVRGSGIPGVMLAVSNFSGKVAKRIALWRPIASTISIGTGASLGIEGPVVQMGASIASMVSGWLKLSGMQRRNFVAVAAASGIAATFNAPIAGVLFALEVILGQFGHRHFTGVVIGAVSAAVVSRQLLGDSLAFSVPNYEFQDLSHLPLYFILGILAAFASLVFIKMVIWGENIFAHISPWLRPMLGGLMVGMLALTAPEILGEGYKTTELTLAGNIVGFDLLVYLTLAKMLATSISLGSWGAGGLFAPLLMIGSTLGAALAQAAGLFGTIESVGPFALVGMAAMFAGTARAPMSTIMMIFEMSGSYGMILPLLLSTVLATLVADMLHPESIYQVILSRRGLSLLRARESDLLQTITTREVMDKDIPHLDANGTLKNLKEALADTHHHGFLLFKEDDPEHMFGIVTMTDLERARQAGMPLNTKLHKVGMRAVNSALPDEPISDVLERMALLEIGRMPVVDPQDKQKPIGFVRQSDLAKAYYRAIMRQRQVELSRESTRLRDLLGHEIVEVKVRPDCPLLGNPLREIKLPRDSIIVSIRKGGRAVFPHGDTIFREGDVVVANVAKGQSKRFKKLFRPTKNIVQSVKQSKKGYNSLAAKRADFKRSSKHKKY